MIPQALPRRVASLSRSTPVRASDRLQTSIRTLAEPTGQDPNANCSADGATHRRMQRAEDTARREIAHADDIECR